MLAIANSEAYCPPQFLVRWLSGRKQRFAKAPYLKRVPRVRIPPSPFQRLIRHTPRSRKAERVHAPEIRICSTALGSKAAGVEPTSISGQHYCSTSRVRNPSLTVFPVPRVISER